ncbi:MAG: phage major tail protein, TP901-1 family [Dialister invisus]|uniref:Phage major tail protein, TP901-1 family n=1 Tax=Dialister invisus TaxID=218538 RepID=A0A930BC24_9FIRM|nr:phage major tail protein, TP901-1 family [Dialister invisus]
MAITKLPENPNKASASLGKEFLLAVNIGTAAVPVWKNVGGQRSTALKRSADEIDASDKTTGGWKVTKAGLRSWSMEAESVVIIDDEGAEALALAFETGKEVNCKFIYPDGSAFTGWGSVTDFSIETPHDDTATLSCTINGNGPLTKVPKVP